MDVKQIWQSIVDYSIKKLDFEIALKEFPKQLKSIKTDEDVRFYTTELFRLLKVIPADDFKNSPSMESVLHSLMELASSFTHMKNLMLESRLYIFVRLENNAGIQSIFDIFKAENVEVYEYPETYYLYGQCHFSSGNYSLALAMSLAALGKASKEDDETLYQAINANITASQFILQEQEKNRREEEEKNRREEAEQKRREDLSLQQIEKRSEEAEEAVDVGEEDGDASDIVDDGNFVNLPGGPPKPGEGDVISTSLITVPYLSDKLLDPSEYTNINWCNNLGGEASEANTAWEAFVVRFNEFEATLETNEQEPAIVVVEDTEKQIVFGMTKLSDAAPKSFVVTRQYQGYEICYFTSVGVKLVKGLLLWMNNRIRRFNLVPELTTESAKQYIFYDDFGVVVNLPAKVVHKHPIGIGMYKSYLNDGIEMLIGLIYDICGGKINRKGMPVMIFHLLEVMKNIESWVNNFEFMTNHPVLWSASNLDSFCGLAKNRLWRVVRRRFYDVFDAADNMTYKHESWLNYVDQHLHVLDREDSYRAVINESLYSKSKGFILGLPVPKSDLRHIEYFCRPMGILYWVRELFSHLSSDLVHEEIMDSIMLLFPVFFCQIAWLLFKLGHGTLTI